MVDSNTCSFPVYGKFNHRNWREPVRNTLNTLDEQYTTNHSIDKAELMKKADPNSRESIILLGNATLDKTGKSLTYDFMNEKQAKESPIPEDALDSFVYINDQVSGLTKGLTDCPTSKEHNFDNPVDTNQPLNYRIHRTREDIPMSELGKKN